MEIDVERTWGYKNPKTGIFTGMAGRLQTKMSDIGGKTQIFYIILMKHEEKYGIFKTNHFGVASVIFITADRVDHLDYLSMEVPSNFAFVLRAPPISYVKNIYYLPFTGVVWVSSISLVMLCTIVVATIIKIRKMENKNINDPSASDYMLFAIASSCQMGTNFITKVLSARISMVGLFQSKSKTFSDFFLLFLRSFVSSLQCYLYSRRLRRILWLCFSQQPNQLEL